MELNEAKDRQYAAAFTAVNAPNVKNQHVISTPQPFPQQPILPMGQPPVRYPDLNTTGGFLEDPSQSAQDMRSVAVRMAMEQEDRREGPFPMEIDNEVLIGPKAPPGYQDNRPIDQLSKDELFERAFKPAPDRHPLLQL